MTPITQITVDDGPLRHALEQLAKAATDLTPAMRKISQTLAFETDQNFRAEGRPRWKALSEVTKQLRQGKKKKPPEKGFRILQKTGSLASSITAHYDESSATVGSNKVYAAIHQFGGQAGRGLKVTIPARPFLPLTADGKLTPETEQAVLDTVLEHLKSAAGV